MPPKLLDFFQATNPGRTLFIDGTQNDQKYYIDFASVRGGQMIEELRDNIILWSPDEATCQLFTGHIGCGKSTELLRLKAELEQAGYHVAYFESSQDLEMNDVDVSDILLAIARRVSESLEEIDIQLRPGYFQNLFAEIRDLLQTPVEISTSAQISLGIAQITAQTKQSPKLRDKLRGYLEPRTKGILEAINEELIEPAIVKLKQKHRQGLVTIVDNLDRIDNTPKPWKRLQQEYLFVDRSEQLRSLNCHVVYTMPLALRFSNDFDTLAQRFRGDPKMLPMVPVQKRDGSQCQKGISLLRQMVLARAFPDLDPEQRLDKISEIFDRPDTLDRLCQVSGGHVRNLLRLLNDSIKREKQLPIARNTLESAIRAYRNQRILAVDETEWALLQQVAERKTLGGDMAYQTLIRSMFVFEYCDDEGPWFDVNPVLVDKLSSK